MKTNAAFPTSDVAPTRKNGTRAYWTFKVVGLVIIASVAGASAWHFASEWQKKLDVPEASVTLTEQAVLNRVSALGRFEPMTRIRRIAPPSGNEGASVLELSVREGDDVEQGQVIAKLDSYPRRAALLQQALAMKGEAEQRLAQTLAGAKPADIAAAQTAYEQAKAREAVAKRMFDRAAGLKQSQTISNDEYDQLKWDFDNASMETKRLSALLESIKEVREIDVNLRKAEVEVQQAAISVAEAELKRATIEAPIAGRILKVHVRGGETIGAEGLVEMGDVRQMAVVAEVFEGDAHRVREGMSAEIRFESMHMVLHGRVAEMGDMVGRKVVLSNDPVSDTDARVLEVRILLNPEDGPKAERFTNARAEVLIDLGSAPSSPSPQPHASRS